MIPSPSGGRSEPNLGSLGFQTPKEDLQAIAALRTDWGRPWRVLRIDCPEIPSRWRDPDEPPLAAYTNSLILNDRVLVPIYDTELDARALQVYAECLPDHEIVGIDCRGVIQYLGAIHCISSALHHDNPLIILHAPLAAQATVVLIR